VVSRVKSDGWTQEAFNAVMKADTAKLPAYVGAETAGLGYQIYRITKVEQPKTVDAARRKAEQEQITAALSQQEALATWTTCARRPRPSC
jgi:peptidyl-prolyl cis-trans isomerase D